MAFRAVVMSKCHSLVLKFNNPTALTITIIGGWNSVAAATLAFVNILPAAS